MKPDKIESLFDSERFDVEAEPPDDINPIRGQSFLAWLVPRLEASGYRVHGPSTEGVGASMRAGPRGPTWSAPAPSRSTGTSFDWTLQITRARSIRERLRGKGRIGLTDPLVQRIEACVREHNGTTQVVIETLDARGRILGDTAPEGPSSP